jgi:toxin ParE1/3/4
MSRKKRRLEWTEKAERDLEFVHAFIAKDKPLAADRFVRKIKRSVENLGHFPHMGEVLARDEDSEIREIYVKSYRIVFRVREDCVRVVTIIHGSRDFSRIEDHLKDFI